MGGGAECPNDLKQLLMQIPRNVSPKIQIGFNFWLTLGGPGVGEHILLDVQGAVLALVVQL